jgi:hypothetical protein
MYRVLKAWKSPQAFVMPEGPFVDNLAGAGRRHKAYDETELRAEAFAAFGFRDLLPEPIYKNFIGIHYLDGAFVHEHTDVAPDGLMHVRVNWMVEKPTAGGNPVLGGVESHVEAGDLWICYASEERHSSVPIRGGQRLVCSFGALIKKPQGFDIKELFV